MMDKIVDYLESFLVSFELSVNNNAFKVDREVTDTTDFLIVNDHFIYNIGSIIEVSFDKVNREYHLVFNKYLYSYAMEKYQTGKFIFAEEERVLNILKYFIEVLEENFNKRLKVSGIY